MSTETQKMIGGGRSPSQPDTSEGVTAQTAQRPSRRGGRARRLLAFAGRWLWLAVVFLCLLIHIYKHVDYENSDFSSELVYAKLLNEEGRLLTDHWYHSTEIRVLDSQLVFAPLFSVFESWHTVRTAGVAILALLLLASYYCLCRHAGMGRLFCWTAPCLMIPFSEGYYQIVFYGACYTTKIAVIFAVLGLALYASAEHGRGKRLAATAFAGVLSLLSGMGGLRQLANLYIPLLLAATILYFPAAASLSCALEGRERRFLKRLFLLSLLFCGLAVAGYMANTRILAQKYSFKSYEHIRFTPFSLDRLLGAFNGLLICFGYQSGGEVFSDQLLHNAICLGLIALTVAAVAYRFATRKKSAAADRFIALFFVLSLALFFGLCTFTDTDYSDRYNLPILVMAFPLIGGLLRDLNWKRSVKTAVCLLLGGCLTLEGALFYAQKHAGPSQSERDRVLDALKQNDYDTGYASYWEGNVLTEMSDGMIELYVYNGYPEAPYNQLYAWFQETSHFDHPPEGKVFMLFNRDEMEKMPFAKTLEGSRVLYQSPQYTVYGFESLKELKAYHRQTFGDGQYLKGGTDANGVRTLEPGGQSSGPYIHLDAGRYTVTVQGNGLDGAQVQVTAGQGKRTLELKGVLRLPGVMVGTFDMDEPADGLECVVRNTSQTPVELTSVTFQQADFRRMFGDCAGLEGGSDDGGIRTLEPGGLSSGPKLDRGPGVYAVTVEGEGLDGVEIAVAAQERTQTFALEDVSRTAERFYGTFTLEEGATGLECLVRNASEEAIRLTGVEIDLIEPR